jgi:hypothetical protein
VSIIIGTSKHFALAARFRIGDGAENVVVPRRMALNLLKPHPAPMSLKRKRFKAALDDCFLLELLPQI